MFPTSFEWTDPIFCITLTETKKTKQKSKTKQNKKPKNNKKEKSNIEKMEKTICSTKTNSPTTTIATGTPTKKIVNEQVTPHRCFNGAYKQ